MLIPSDSALVVNALTQQEAQREEQQHMKRLVLDYEKREEESQWKQTAGDKSPENTDMSQAGRRGQRTGKKKQYLMHTGGGGGAAYSRDR
jgi:regulator of nonsense transcripts 2